MGKRTYDDYIKNGCNPTGYNEACESIIFGQITVDSLLDEISNLKEDLNNSEQKCLICNKEQQNDQLKQQLAEKELELQQKNKLIIQEDGECVLCGDCYCINNDVRKIIEENTLLKQQLAEKEEELKKFKSIGATPRQLQRAYQDRFKYNERCCELKKQHIQNKINFAVEQLEKVKGKFGYKFNSQLMISSKVLCDYINQQIEELRGEK